MNAKHIQYILTIVREGSITAASKKLQISQPSLSQTIKIIERDLGAEVFDRNTDPISLTYAGQKYVDAAQKIVDIERNLLDVIHISKNEVHATIHLGISDHHSLSLLPQAIPAFKSIYPFVKFKLHEHGSEQLARMTLDGLCDLSFVTTRKVCKGLQYTLINSEELYLVSSRTTDLARRFSPGTPISVHEAQDECFIRLNSEHSLRATEDRIFEKQCFSPCTLLETSALDAAMSIMATSNAVMILPYSLVEKNLSIREHIQYHPLIDNTERCNLYSCYRKDFPFTRYMGDFLHIIHTRFGNLPVFDSVE